MEVELFEKEGPAGLAGVELFGPSDMNQVLGSVHIRKESDVTMRRCRHSSNAHLMAKNFLSPSPYFFVL